MKATVAVLTLSVAFAFSRGDAISTDTTVPSDSPRCDPGGPYSGWGGCPVEFDGSGSEAPGGSIVSYLWHFGDGATGQGATPTHVYYGDHLFYVILVVTDDQGRTSACSTFAAVTSDVILPSLECNAGGPYAGAVGQEIYFEGTAATEESPVYHWAFGDGATAIGSSVAHTYSEAGRFRAVLTVNDLVPLACHQYPREDSCEANVQVEVNPVEPTTWGAMKAFYREAVAPRSATP